MAKFEILGKIFKTFAPFDERKKKLEAKSLKTVLAKLRKVS